MIAPGTAITRNSTRADRVIAFMNQLPIIDGPAIGEIMKIDPWEEAWIRDIYEPSFDDGTRVVRTAILSVARKNRKSYLVSGLMLCHLIGPEAETNGQIYSCANDRNQARVVYNMMCKMIRMTPALGYWLEITSSTNVISVKRSDCIARGSVYKALSADAATKHGLGPSFFVYDEYGEARTTDTLYDTMVDGQQAMASPLAVVISTQNDDPQHPLSLMIDDGLRGEDPTLVCHLYAADEDCALDDPEQWLKANPALACWKSDKAIAAKAAEAKRLPSKERNFRRRYLNQRVNSTDSLITRAEWKLCQAEYVIAEKEPVILGLDLSAHTDLTALVLGTAGEETFTEAWFWKPRAYIDEHTRRDRVRYDLYAREGHLQVSPGKVIRYHDVAEKVVELCAKYDVEALVYDRAMMKNLLPIFDEMNFATYMAGDDDNGGLRLVPWGQGAVSMTPAINAFENAILEGKLKHPNHPLLNICVMNAQVNSDAKGNRTFDKLMSRMRIDGAVALAMLLGFKSQSRKKPKIVNPYEQEGFSLASYF